MRGKAELPIACLIPSVRLKIQLTQHQGKITEKFNKNSFRNKKELCFNMYLMSDMTNYMIPTVKQKPDIATVAKLLARHFEKQQQNLNHQRSIHQLISC